MSKPEIKPDNPGKPGKPDKPHPSQQGDNDDLPPPEED